MKSVITTLKLLLLLYQAVRVCSGLNLVITRFEDCSKDNTSKFYGNIILEGGNHILDIDITLQRPLDETVGCVCEMESSLDGKIYLPVMTIREKNACKAANTYLGELWYDIVRAAQVTPGGCPIPARRYYVHHHVLDFKKMTLQTLPFGRLRTKINVVDNNSRNKSSLFCILTEVENFTH